MFRDLQLYLVFEYLECDLRRYLDSSREHPHLKMTPALIKVVRRRC